MGKPVKGEDVIEYAKIALADELFAAKIYSMASRIGKHETTRSRLLRIAEMERGHAEFWQDFLKKRGVASSKIGISSLKTILYALVLRVFGLALTFRLMETGERDAAELYSKMLENPALGQEEKEVIKRILEEELIHEQELVEEESRFKELLDHVRDAVLGMNDGLVEILSVTAGLAGAYGNPFHVALGGLVVAVAGALSMGIGAYVAARAQRQVHEGALGRIGLAVKYAAHVFKERVRRFMLNKGYSEDTSTKVAEESMKDPKLMSRIIAEEEYGLKAEKLENPSAAGLYTGLAYLLSAFLPVLPYFMGLPILPAMLLSLLFAGLALSATGFVIAISADLPVKRKMLEMILAGFGSAAVTFMIGRLLSAIFGVTVD